MSKDKLEALACTQTTRRSVLKGLLIGLGAGVLVQANGGVTSFAREGQEPPQKTEKGAIKKTQKGGDIKKGTDIKGEKAGDIKREDIKKAEKSEHKKEAKGEKSKTEEPKQQHKKQ